MLKTVPGIRAARALKAFRAWAEERRGAAAVEFALVAVPFFFLLFGLIEIALIFVVSTMLEHALIEASRDIRTGVFQAGGFSETDFRTKVCENIADFMSCNDALKFDVRKFDNFAAATNPNPINDEGEIDADSFAFAPGGSNEIVVVRAFYTWSLITPVLSKPLENMSNGRRLIASAVVFRNEPF